MWVHLVSICACALLIVILAAGIGCLLRARRELVDMERTEEMQRELDAVNPGHAAWRVSKVYVQDERGDWVEADPKDWGF